LLRVGRLCQLAVIGIAPVGSGDQHGLVVPAVLVFTARSSRRR
jgi:hypothetical protein